MGSDGVASRIGALLEDAAAFAMAIVQEAEQFHADGVAVGVLDGLCVKSSRADPFRLFAAALRATAYRLGLDRIHSHVLREKEVQTASQSGGWRHFARKTIPTCHGRRDRRTYAR